MVVTNFKALSQHLLEGTRENHEKTQDNWSLVRGVSS